MPNLDGNTHINLTVSDIDRSAEWYCRVFGFVVVNDVSPHESSFRFSTLVQPASLASLVLGALKDRAEPQRFDNHRIGLHHFAFHVPERHELNSWARHLDELGVPHSEISESPFETGVHIHLYDPDGIWLELYWVNRAFFASGLRRIWRASRKAGMSRPWSAASRG